MISKILFRAAELLDGNPPTNVSFWYSTRMIFDASGELFTSLFDGYIDFIAMPAKIFFLEFIEDTVKNEKENDESEYSLLQKMSREELDELHNSRVMRLLFAAEIAKDLGI